MSTDFSKFKDFLRSDRQTQLLIHCKCGNMSSSETAPEEVIWHIK